MNFIATSFSEKGKNKTINQDYLIADNEKGIFIICDGVTGNNAGEVAAEIAARTAYEYLKKEFQSKPTNTNYAMKQCIRAALDLATKAVIQKSNEDHSLKGMATTFDLLIIKNDTAYLAHLGNGRLYLKRNSVFHQITHDHTVAQDFISSGQWTLEQAKKSPYYNTLSQCIGTTEQPKFEYLEIELDHNDSILMCSNGVYRYFDNKKFEDIFSIPEFEEISRNIRTHITNGGAEDNFSCVAIHIPSKDKISHRKIPLKVEVLKNLPIFRNFSYAELLKTLECSKIRMLNAGDILFNENDHGEEMYVILSGRLHIKKSEKSLSDRKPGDVIGEMSMIDNAPRSATIIAAEESALLVFPRNSIYELFNRELKIAAKFFWSVSVELNTKLRETSFLLVNESPSTQTFPAISPFSD